MEANYRNLLNTLNRVSAMKLDNIHSLGHSLSKRYHGSLIMRYTYPGRSLYVEYMYTLWLLSHEHLCTTLGMHVQYCITLQETSKLNKLMAFNVD